MDVAVGDGLLGRVIDPLGKPLDGKGPVAADQRLPGRTAGAGDHGSRARQRASADRTEGRRCADSRRRAASAS